MIYGLTRRPLFVRIGIGLVLALSFGSAAFAMAMTVGSGRVVPGLVVGAGAGLALALWSGVQLLIQPANRLGFFRDRLVVIQGQEERYARWDRIELVTLAAPAEWRSGEWPNVDLTDRLTILLQRGRQIVFRPAAFGLDPSACRDLVIRLRDDPHAGRRLPEFDSALDVASRPAVTGELLTPRI